MGKKMSEDPKHYPKTAEDAAERSPVEQVVMPEGIEKGEWLKRCAARFVERADLCQETAEECAETCLESTMEFEDWESTPEECADNEMSYWDD